MWATGVQLQPMQLKLELVEEEWQEEEHDPHRHLVLWLRLLLNSSATRHTDSGLVRVWLQLVCLLSCWNRLGTWPLTLELARRKYAP